MAKKYIRKNKPKNVKISNCCGLKKTLKSGGQNSPHSMTKNLYTHIGKNKNEIIDKLSKIFSD